MAAIAYWILVRTIIAGEGRDSLVAKAIGKDTKGVLSALLALVAIPLAFVSQWLSLSLYVIIALMWLVPDRRIEKLLPEFRDR